MQLALNSCIVKMQSLNWNAMNDALSKREREKGRGSERNMIIHDQRLPSHSLPSLADQRASASASPVLSLMMVLCGLFFFLDARLCGR